jgi:DNA-binding IclR family transcriptional regulator
VSPAKTSSREAPAPAADNEAPAKDGVAAVDRALSILLVFRPEDEALTLRDLAQRTGMYKSTILRLLASLERHEFIVRLEGGRYQLGPTLFRLGGLYQRSLKLQDHVLPVLHQLVRQSGESASFYTRQGTSRLCLFRVDSPHSVRDHVRVGDLLPLDRGAAGHLLLAWGGPGAAGPRAKPLVVTRGERDPETGAVAAVVLQHDGLASGVLSISGPVNRFTEDKVAEWSRHLRQAASDLTRRFGGDPARLTEG